MKRLFLVLSVFMFVDVQGADYDDLLLRPDQYEAYEAMLKNMHERAKKIHERAKMAEENKKSNDKKSSSSVYSKSSPSFVPGLSRTPGLLKEQGTSIKPKPNMLSNKTSQSVTSPSFVPGLVVPPPSARNTYTSFDQRSSGFKKQGPPIKPKPSMQFTRKSQSAPSPSFVPGLVVPPPSARNTYTSFDQGASKEYEEPQVKLRQFQVSEQGNNEDGGASCGYHAIKNAMSILSGDLTLLNNVDFVKENFDLYKGKWRMWVANKLSEFDPEGNSDTDWIGVDMLGGLIKEVFPYKNYSIISSDGRSCDVSNWGKDELAKVKAIMDGHDGREYKHTFFMNTANLDLLLQNRDSLAHWFTLVVEKKPDNSVIYTVTDSLGNVSRMNDRSVLNVIRRLSADQ